MAGQRKGPDWSRIKAEYLAGGTSYRKLAGKYGVNQSTLEKRAKRECWADGLRQTSGEIAAELPAVVANVALDEAAEWVRESLRIAREARAELWAARHRTQSKVVGSPDGPVIRELPFLNAPADWRAFIQSLDALDEMGRRGLGLDQPAPTPGEGDDVRPGVVIVPADSDGWADD